MKSKFFPEFCLAAYLVLTPLAQLRAAEPAAKLLAPPAPPVALYLTWQHDPAHTMTVHWHTVWREGFRDSVLEYRVVNAAQPDAAWQRALGASHPMPFTERMVHTVEIAGLAPDTVYEFRLGRLRAGKTASPEFLADGAARRFRTLPEKLTRPVRFVAGGDAYGEADVFTAMNRTVAARDPEFALMGGDIAYANGNPALVDRWFEFFRIWTETMVTADGRLIPLVPAIGNHEVHGDAFDLRGEPGTGLLAERAPIFYSVFSFPGRAGYNVLDCGNYLSVIALDSAHTQPIAGAQTEWLRQVLAARRNVPFVVPIYHIGAYPSVRPSAGPITTAIRANWVPLFDEAKLRFVFENHDHAYKITYAMRAGQRDPAGTRYLGDGAWAIKPRQPQPAEQAPYLERSAGRNHLLVVTLHPDRADFIAVDPAGEEFDHFTIPVQR